MSLPASLVAFTTKHLVIGGGIVGLATAARLSKEGPTLLVEKNMCIGEEVSSHNSEVIHAGIYYPSNTLKAKTCVKGRRMLYSVCTRFGIPHRKIGKWILATTPNEVPKLMLIQKSARECGVPLDFLPKKDIQEEPNVKAHEVLYSPETGIIDSHQLMVFLEHAIEKNGGQIALRTHVEDIDLHGKEGYLIKARDNENNQFFFQTDSIVNSAGLWSDKIAKIIMKGHYLENYNLYYCKGHYFSYSGPPLLKTPRLLYPIPEPGLRGLGIHATFNLAGGIRFGPDTKYLDHLNYNFDENEIPSLREKFYTAVKSYIPTIEKSKIHPDYTGIRPKLSGPNDTSSFKDFIIQGEESHGFPGLVNLIGIESPGLTASLAIGEEVAHLLGYKAMDEFQIK